MSNRSHATKNARKLERLYRTKEHGTTHMTVLRLIKERGLEGAMAQLEAWGMRPTIGPSDIELNAAISEDKP